MPITYVLKVAVPSDQSIQQHKEILEKRLAALRPKRLNKLHVQAVVYQTPNQNQIHQFLHSDYSATCFSIIEQPAVNYLAGDIKVLTGTSLRILASFSFYFMLKFDKINKVILVWHQYRGLFVNWELLLNASHCK